MPIKIQSLPCCPWCRHDVFYWFWSILNVAQMWRHKLRQGGYSVKLPTKSVHKFIQFYQFISFSMIPPFAWSVVSHTYWGVIPVQSCPTECHGSKWHLFQTYGSLRITACMPHLWEHRTGNFWGHWFASHRSLQFLHHISKICFGVTFPLLSLMCIHPSVNTAMPSFPAQHFITLEKSLTL